MSSSDSKLLTYAKKEALDAIALQEAGKYHQAINKYERASEILIEFLKFNKNPIMRQSVQKSVEEYINQAKILKVKVGGRSPSRSGSGKPSEDKTQGEGLSEEDQSLVNTISDTNSRIREL